MANVAAPNPTFAAVAQIAARNPPPRITRQAPASLQPITERLMPDFFVPITPTNFRDDWGRLEVTGDVYNICRRMRELSPNLRLRERRDWDDGGFRYIVSEISLDGAERWVMGLNELDGRLIERLQRMLHVPFEDRFAAAERAETKLKAQQDETKLDMLAENIGLPMLTDLERTGFVSRPRSYAKAGHVGGRGSLRRG